MQLRREVCRNAYHVAASTHNLVLFSLYGDNIQAPKNDHVGLNEVVRSILSSFDLHREASPIHAEKKRLLTTEFRTSVADDVMVNTSPLLQSLLNCLLGNADKYATGGNVLVSCYADTNGKYAISVSNEGPTIPAKDAQRIFEPFVRLSADEESLGIGLPLARRLAISMDYTLVLDTEFTGGVRFVLSGI